MGALPLSASVQQCRVLSWSHAVQWSGVRQRSDVSVFACRLLISVSLVPNEACTEYKVFVLIIIQHASAIGLQTNNILKK